MLNFPRQGQNDIDAALRSGYLAMLREKEAAKQAEYIKSREYYEGIHDTEFIDRVRQFLRVGSSQTFNANYCHMVVNAKADRLTVTGFKTLESDDSKVYGQWWKKNRMDRKQGIVHTAAIRDGDSFVLVEWDNVAKMPRFNYEPAFAGDGVMVYYSDERRDEIAFASKHWRVSLGASAGTMRRLNLYFPDHIEKYISKDGVNLGQWGAYLEDENSEEGQGYIGQAGIVWWTDNGTSSGLPLGVPIVHFKNNDVGDHYGISHIAHVMPLQDALNKSLIDLIAAQDVEGFGLLVGYGDDWSGIKVGPGAIVHTTAPKTEAQLERLAGGNPDGLIAAYSMLVGEIARVSGTPLSYIQSSGQVAAEGTMKQQETALVSQVQKSQIDFGNAWEDCMIIARRLNNAFSDNTLDEDVIIETVWKEAVSRNEKEQAETLAIKVEKLGITQDQAQVEMNYSDELRQEFAREKMKQEAKEAQMMAKQQAPNDKSMQQNMNQTDSEDEPDEPS